MFYLFGRKKCGHRLTADQVVVIVERKRPCWIPVLDRHFHVELINPFTLFQYFVIPILHAQIFLTNIGPKHGPNVGKCM